MSPRKAKTFVMRSLFCASLLSVSIGVGNIAASQESKAAVQEPQYINEFNAIGSGGTIVPLESVTLTMESQTHNHFINVTASGGWVAPNAKSTVRLTPSAHFVVKVPPGYASSVNPATVVFLRPFTVEKGKRMIATHTAKAGMFQGVKSQTAADNTIPLTFKPYGQSSLEIIPAQPLPAGEYELAGTGPQQAFCFGIDAQ